MNELIKLSSARINDETVQTCSARDLHRFLGIGKDFSTWVKAQIERAAFAENVDYVKISGKSLSPKRGNSGKTPTEYFFTISASKEISMMSNTPRGKEARLYFIECERVAKEATAKLRAQPAAFALPDFTNPACEPAHGRSNMSNAWLLKLRSRVIRLKLNLPRLSPRQTQSIRSPKPPKCSASAPENSSTGSVWEDLFTNKAHKLCKFQSIRA